MSSPAPSELVLDGIEKAYGQFHALHPTHLAVGRSEFVTILGPSGCGKSTLLRIVTGITTPTGGRIILRDQDITHFPPEKRDIGIVFQSYALFPHMTVADNIRFGLKMKKIPADERKRRFDHVISICDLGHLVNRNPRDLSGGQQQRVALARSLVMEPALLLLDEPLSNLDAKLRETLRDDLLALHRQTGATSLYVTHDQAEAMSMSDRVIVMNFGRVVEIGTPRELYLTPKTRFTAEFLGHTNVIAVDARGLDAGLPWGDRIRLTVPADGPGNISLRPESLRIIPDPEGPALVRDLIFLGADVIYTLGLNDLTLRARRDSGDEVLEQGTRVRLAATAAAHLLDGAASEEAA